MVLHLYPVLSRVPALELGGLVVLGLDLPLVLVEVPEITVRDVLVVLERGIGVVHFRQPIRMLVAPSLS